MVVTRDNPMAQRILDAAVRLFAQKGFAATSTREIVEAARVTKPMLYYYFDSKEGLCRAALERFRDQFEARLQRVLGEPREPLERLVDVVWAHLEFCRTHEDIARLFYALYFGPAEEVSWLNLEQYVCAGNECLMQVVEEAERASLLRPGCQQAFIMALHGMINIWVILFLKEHERLTRKVAQQIVEDLLGGYGRR
jgi:AcrR family transcriptional regulator